MYWLPGRGMPKLVMASLRFSRHNNHLIIGGKDNVISAYNAAIGRRLCPACYEQGIKAPVTERANKGRCSRCFNAVDYIISTYPPYFFYFSHQANNVDKKHIEHGTPEQSTADLLKQAMLDNEPRDLLFPTRLLSMHGSMAVDMRVPAYMGPVVFNMSETGSYGKFGNTTYDFRVKL